MITNEPVESMAVVVSEVISQMTEKIASIGHPEHDATSIEIFDRDRLEPLVVVGAEDLDSPADVVPVNSQ